MLSFFASFAFQQCYYFSDYDSMHFLVPGSNICLTECPSYFNLVIIRRRIHQQLIIANLSLYFTDNVLFQGHGHGNIPGASSV